MEKDIGFVIEAVLKSSSEKVWTYFVDPELLKMWLGASSGISPDSDDFIVVSSIPYLSGRHKILEIVAGREMRIAWYVEGIEGRVSIRISEEEENTKLEIKGRIPSQNMSARVEELAKVAHSLSFFGGSWQHALLDLKQAVESGETGVMVPPRENNGHVVHLEVDIRSRPEKVWHLLTSAEELRKMAPDFHLEGTKVEAVEGGVYSYGWYPEGTSEQEMNDGPSKIIECKPNEKLVTNWHSRTELMESVQWLMKEIKGGVTRLMLIHRDILNTTEGDVWSYRSGWTAELYAIKWYLETGELESEWWKASYEAEDVS